MTDKRTESQFPDNQVIFRKGNENDTNELYRRASSARRAERSLSASEQKESGNMYHVEHFFVDKGDTSKLRHNYVSLPSHGVFKGKLVEKVEHLTDFPVSGRANMEAEKRINDRRSK